MPEAIISAKGTEAPTVRSGRFTFQRFNSAFRISRTAAQSYSCKDWGHSAYLKPLEWWLKPTTHDGNLPKALRWPKRLTVAKAHVSYPHPAEVLSKFAL